MSIGSTQVEILTGQDQLNTTQASIEGEQAVIKNSLGELDLAFRQLNSNIDQLGKLSTSIEGDTKAIRETIIGAGAPVEPELPPTEGTQTPTPDSSDPDDSDTNDSTPARVHLSIGIAAHDHWACPAGEDCRWMQVSHSGLGEGPWEVKCATRGLSPSQSNNVDPDSHEVWRVYETTFNPTNGCLYWHEGNTVYVIMDNMHSNELLWNP